MSTVMEQRNEDRIPAKRGYASLSGLVGSPSSPREKVSLPSKPIVFENFLPVGFFEDDSILGTERRQRSD